MGQVQQFFQPPLYWQQFEDLTQSVVQEIFHIAFADKIGRPGQAQHGVDVFGNTQNSGRVGVQCKRLDDLDDKNHPYPGGPITATVLRAEVTKALAFSPKLDLFVLATTAKRDAKVQRVARQLDEEHQHRDCFGVRLWFWDDYVTWLNCYADLQHWYYDEVIQVRDPRDQDQLILELIKTAFDRPAFVDALHHEHLDDFLQALKDTQATLRTGELVNRETRHVIRKTIGGWRSLSNAQWKDQLKKLVHELKEFRGLLVDGIKDGRLQQRKGYLDIHDSTLRLELDQRRRRCMDHLNGVLRLAKLPTL